MRHNEKVASGEGAVFEAPENSLKRVVKMKICVSLRKHSHVFVCHL